MTAGTWLRSPIGRTDAHWATRCGTKSVLVLVPHVVAGARLLDLLPLLEADHRVQVAFTDPEGGDNWQATHEFLRAQGGPVLPWAQARRSDVDLVLAGSTRGIDDFTAPVVLVPHGGGLGQYRPWRPPFAVARRHDPQLGLGPDQLVREGRVRADALVLVHDRERELLAEACPRALPTAVVAGDVALDRITASLPHRDRYRHALGATEDDQVVVVTSTWSPRSAFGRHPDLFDRVLAALPRDGYRVVGVLHPAIWAHHGTWQIRSWLAAALRSGLVLLPPEEGWRAALVAADHVLGDYGSVTGYGAAAGASILLAGDPGQPLLCGTPAEVLARHAPRWQPGRPLRPQLRAAREARDAAGLPDVVRGLLTSRPDEAGTILRRTLYRLLGIPEPAHAVPVAPVPLPKPVTA
ncbi:hypothetical protein SAMN04489727_7930 [Amycolatopsis tolypomycina]|uniref:CDP-Glycerol:Poly(Glycerophosphate) glycerophosphotransferase n=1 Tax=Amycolatopsis tolypomycina TaxID=208445 RepID=A0A1H5AUD6_9PSEU|nr:hypothetical protein [Amycolatopsis tolypomycina]SED45334.1 hypothetical protein SAMN04489727_7930 [Amycolatopsis tolypomycina]